jgi:hypothetical protein
LDIPIHLGNIRNATREPRMNAVVSLSIVSTDRIKRRGASKF